MNSNSRRSDMAIRAEIVASGSNTSAVRLLNGTAPRLDVGSVSRVILDVHADAVVAYERRGDDLYLRLSDGTVVRLVDFFRADEDGLPTLWLLEDQAYGEASDCYVEVSFPETREGILRPTFGEAACEA